MVTMTCNKCIFKNIENDVYPCNECDGIRHNTESVIFKRSVKLAEDMTSFENPENAKEILRSSILEYAKELLNGDRQKQYGDPVENYEKIATIYNTLNGIVSLDAEDIALIMVIVKLVREQHQHKADNLIDAAAYLEIYNRIKEQ